MCIIIVFASLLLILSISAFIELTSVLYQRLDFTNKENAKLLNGMHEGLMIFCKPEGREPSLATERKMMFCNKAADQILTNLDVEH